MDWDYYIPITFLAKIVYTDEALYYDHLIRGKTKICEQMGTGGEALTRQDAVR